MKKIVISQLWLYRHRFAIGYVVLGVAFTVMLFMMPIIAQAGISEAEMQSTTSSYALGKEGILNGDLVDLPYRLMQKLSILVFGLTPYAIKLPSIIIGLLLGFLLILLLNRWFKNNVSLLASTLVVLSTPFLFLAGSGTSLIMLVFWPTLLLWLGSKIQGENRPKPMYSFVFAIAMLMSIFTPFMIYFAVFCVVFVLVQPHLRFVLKNLPKLPLFIVAVIILGGFAVLGISIFHHPETIKGLLFTTDFHGGEYLGNIAKGFAPVFSWHNTIESVFLSPLISLPILALALIGLFSATKGFFASRNSIASILIVFTIVVTGFNPSAVVLIILPLSILTAHGLKYILEKWYGLFPSNPYARIFALLPLVILFSLMIIPGSLQYIYGYRYNPNIANEFSYDLEVIRENLTDEVLVAGEKFDFYQMLQDSMGMRVARTAEEGVKIVSERKAENAEATETLAYLGKPEKTPENYHLYRIVTSPMRENSDVVYIYVKSGAGTSTDAPS
ncbi:glycosyltransferase family 39 protein [Candidatus Saccharibacteria bacterium]|nr:glycosyltransferase family 39 protein [Candidatus Saccharibacteria bacterium]